jgi:hypothetical protein
MNDNKLRIKAFNNPHTGAVEFYISYKDQNGRRMVGLPMEFVFEAHEEGRQYPPTWRIDAFEAQDFLTALANALDEQGVKTDNDHKIAGTLEATRVHLDDMRRIALQNFPKLNSALQALDNELKQ